MGPVPPLPLPPLTTPGHSSTSPNLGKLTIHSFSVFFFCQTIKHFVALCFVDQSSFQNEGNYLTRLWWKEKGHQKQVLVTPEKKWEEEKVLSPRDWLKAFCEIGSLWNGEASRACEESQQLEHHQCCQVLLNILGQLTYHWYYQNISEDISIPPF